MSKQNAQRDAECGSETGRDFGPVTGQQHLSGLSHGPGRAGARSPESGQLPVPPPTSGAQHRASRQVSLLICEPVVFSFGFCFHVCLPLPVPPAPPPAWKQTKEQRNLHPSLTSRVLYLLT